MNEMENDMISVIIPVYNVLPYLDECIDSVVHQTYTNLEIILVDDGSVDGSETGCDRWAEQDSRIRVVHQKNKGLSAARNAGLDICKGEWIVFVDGDDVLPKEAIEILRGMVNYEEKVFIAQGGMGTLQRESPARNAAVTVMPGRNALIEGYIEVMACGKIFHKSIWRTRRFQEGIIHEDYQISYQIIYETTQVAQTDRIVYYVRKREGSITRSSFSEKKLVIIEIDEERILYFRGKNEPELLEQAYRSYYGDLLHLYKLSRKKEIIYKYRQHYKYFIQLHNIGLKTKFKLTICYFFPLLWEWRKE